MTAQLPALQVVIPLICAPLCVLLRSKTAAWLLFLVAALGSLACAVALTEHVARVGTVRYAMGGWPSPAGIEFVVSGFNTPILLIVSLIAAVSAVYSRRSVAAEVDASRTPPLYACLCLVLSALLGLAITGDAFNAFVFLEIGSLATYTLIALGRRRRALLASFRYLVIGTVGATFVLLGIGLAYAVTGTLNMADIGQRLTESPGNRALYAAVVFVFIGLAIKMALFPLHSWLPGAYGEAPSVVSTFIAATSTKVAIYLFCRFAFTIFGAALVFGVLPIEQIGLVLASLAMLAGSAVACFQNDFRYLLAWSSVAPDRLHRGRGQPGHLGRCLGGLPARDQPRDDQGRAVRRCRPVDLAARFGADVRPCRPRPPHAVDVRGDRDRRPRTGRRSAHRGVRQQMGAG